MYKSVDIDHLMGDDFLGELRGMQRNVRGTALKNFLSHPVFEQAYLKSERLQCLQDVAPLLGLATQTGTVTAPSRGQPPAQGAQAAQVFAAAAAAGLAAGAGACQQRPALCESRLVHP